VTALDAADLVVIAGRTLGISTDAALARMDLAAARDALAEAALSTAALSAAGLSAAGLSAAGLSAAGPPGQPPGTELRDRATAAAAGVGLVRALLRHRPFPEHGQQVAVAAGLQLLSLNGWRADLSPAATAAVVVEALASGQLAPEHAAAWLSPRLSADPRTAAGARPERAGAAGPRPGLPVSLAAVRVPARRAIAAALLAVAVTGAALLSAACSRGPAVPAVPPGGVSVVQQSPP
jgi:hypothetical protein